MTELQWPDQVSPDLPAISLRLPDGWTSVGAAGLIAAWSAPERPGQFTPNITLSMQRVSADAAIEHVADAARVAASSLPEYISMATYEAGTTHRWACHDYTYRLPEGIGVVQIVGLCLVRSGAVPTLVQLTGTVGGDRLDDYEPVRQAVQQALVIER